MPSRARQRTSFAKSDEVEAEMIVVDKMLSPMDQGIIELSDHKMTTITTTIIDSQHISKEDTKTVDMAMVATAVEGAITMTSEATEVVAVVNGARHAQCSRPP